MKAESTGKAWAIDDRRLSVIVFSLLFCWILAFPFEGQVLYAIAEQQQTSVRHLIYATVAAHFIGLFFCGFFIRTMKAAKNLLLCFIVFGIAASGVFFFPPSFLWTAALAAASVFAGGAVAAWAFFLKSGTPKTERIKTIADGLICSNVLMILLNMAAIHLSPRLGLGLAMLGLGLAFPFVRRLPQGEETADREICESGEQAGSIRKPLAFLCLFIVVITINSGLMYQVQGPAFSHLEWLTSWYWAIPYIAALAVMRNLPPKTNRAYILFVAIAMIGFSFIAFLLLDRSWTSYLLVNTLMLGACGVYDLFWWSILGEMLELDRNPAKILGIGLSANVLGVLLGGMIGNGITAAEGRDLNATLLALAVVCVTLVMLPPLHKQLSKVLQNHAYLTKLLEMPAKEQKRLIRNLDITEKFTGRENEIAALLLTAKTYRMIAGELNVSENTVKTHVKNIYAKTGVQSRTELMHVLLNLDADGPDQPGL